MIDEFLAHQQTRGYTFKTVQRRALSLKRLGDCLDGRSVLDASWEDVDRLLALLVSSNSRHAYRSDLIVFYRWARKRRLAATNPADETDPIKVHKGLPRPAPKTAIVRAMATSTAELQLAILLGALAGLRVGEIARLRASDCHLDFSPPVAHIVAGKCHKDRIVPLAQPLVDRLRGRSGWLFPSTTGPDGHVTPRRMSVWLCKALSDDDLRCSGHQLRHFFGTEAARSADGNVLLVASLMGHQNLSVTMGYIGWVPTGGAAVVESIAARERLGDDAVGLQLVRQPA